MQRHSIWRWRGGLHKGARTQDNKLVKDGSKIHRQDLCIYQKCLWSISRKLMCLSYIHFFFKNFKLNVLGWHELIKLYRFQMQNSIVHYLYVALHVYPPKTNLLSSYIWPPFTLHCLTHPPSPLVTTILSQCVWVFVCLSAVFFHLLLSVLYLTYEWNQMVLNIRFHLTYFA